MATCKTREKPLSLHPLTPEEALAQAMNTPPPEPKKKPQKKGKKAKK